MFSVNVDKLIANREEEIEAYNEIAEKILNKKDKHSTISVLGNNVVAFKLAETLYHFGNSVLFIDADFSSEIFIGKYKLGKNLKGVCDYLAGEEVSDNILCYTNKDKFNIVFTGNVDEYAVVPSSDVAFMKLLTTYRKDFDYVVVTASDDMNTAKSCDGTVVVLENRESSDRKIKKFVQKLEKNGCTSIGIIVNNV